VSIKTCFLLYCDGPQCSKNTLAGNGKAQTVDALAKRLGWHVLKATRGYRNVYRLHFCSEACRGQWESAKAAEWAAQKGKVS